MTNIRCDECKMQINPNADTHICSQLGSTTKFRVGENTHTCFYRFLDYLGAKKDEATFYCQICLEIRKVKL